MADGNRASGPLEGQARTAKPISYVAPRTELEVTLAQIWADILAVDRVGVYDGFFELGGHSQLVVRLQLRLGEVLNRDVPVTALFQYTTIDSLGQYLDAEGEGS